MRAETKINNNNFESLEMTISFTMTIGEWRLIQRDMGRDSIPAMGFGNLLRDTLESFHGATQRHVAPSPGTGE